MVTLKKLTRSFLIIIGFVVFITPLSARAADSPVGEQWFCLKSVQCSTSGAGCSNKGDRVHRAKLSIKDIKASVNTPTYILECIATNKSQYCTTGNDALDTKIFGSAVTPLSILSKAVNYNYHGMFQTDGVTAATNPTTTSTGDIGPFEWESVSVDAGRKFMAMSYLNTNTVNGNAGGQQQGTFDFDTAQKSCVPLHWDPDGRVFDSKSFEPISNAQVSLYVQRANGQFELLNPAELGASSVLNPFITREDGFFKFVVPDGTYQLKVAASGYTFESVVAQSPLFRTTTYSDIYSSRTGANIVQKGAAQHRDIPVDAVGVPTNTPVTLMEYFYTINKLTSSLVIEGHASHPFTTIKTYGQLATASANIAGSDRGDLLTTTTTGADGIFSISIPLSNIPKGQIFGSLELIKANIIAQLPGSFLQKIVAFAKRIFIPETLAQQSSTSIRFEPILNYIEGYAYNSQGNSIPNAKVGAYLTFSSKPYVEVTADAKGYYKIGAEMLPSMSYVLRYTSSGGVVTNLNLSTFLRQNNTYLTQNKIDLSQPKTTASITSGKTKEATQSSSNTFFRENPIAAVSPAANGNPAGTANQSNGSGNIMLLVIAVVALIVSVVVLVVFGLRKRQQFT